MSDPPPPPPPPPIDEAEPGSGSDAEWTMQVDPLSERARELRVVRDGVPVGYGEVVRLWREDRGFRVFFDAALAEAPYQAVFWETPPVTRSTLDQPFRCVLIDAPSLARVMPERFVFEAELQAAGSSGVATFPNLGGDALLVVPAARTDDEAYPHLAAFLRHAPEEQRHALWIGVGEAIESRLGERRLWVSTSGLGVAWLHVRLDSVPKYYVHAPYRDGPW